MRLGDLDALKEEIGSWGMNDYEPSDFIDAIDNAPTVEPFERIGSICEENCGYRDLISRAQPASDRYDEGFRDGYAQCINDKEERKINNRLFQKGGAEE